MRESLETGRELTYDAVYNCMFTKHDDFAGSRDQDILLIVHPELTELTTECFICRAGNSSRLSCRARTLVRLDRSTPLESLGPTNGPRFSRDGIRHERVIHNRRCARTLGCQRGCRCAGDGSGFVESFVDGAGFDEGAFEVVD